MLSNIQLDKKKLEELFVCFYYDEVNEIEIQKEIDHILSNTSHEELKNYIMSERISSGHAVEKFKRLERMFFYIIDHIFDNNCKIDFLKTEILKYVGKEYE